MRERLNLVAAVIVLVAAVIYAVARSSEPGAEPERSPPKSKGLPARIAGALPEHGQPRWRPPAVTTGPDAGAPMATATATATEAAAQNEPPWKPSPAEARERIVAMRRDRTEQFEFERADAAWAGQAAYDLRANLEKLGSKQGYATKSVDCRATLCRASLEWPSYREAQTTWRSVLHQTYEPNCATEVYVPPPDADEGPYEGTIIFDCSDAR